MSSLKHPNGRPVCQLYSFVGQGPIISFNLVAADGSPIGFASFDNVACQQKFAVRTGGMCNPGGVSEYLDLSSEELRSIFGDGRVCGDDTDIVNGKSIGAIRISFGACSTVEEASAFVDFVRKFYIEEQPVAE